jgi:hypothetical protein
LPSAQWARVVISHVSTSTYTDPDTGDIYITTATDYKQIKDVNLSSSTTTSIPVPPNTGYQVDIVSYLVFSDHNTLLKYGKSAAPVDITSGNTTTVTITAVPFDAGLAPPTSIASGALYNVAVSYGGSPLRGERNLLVSGAPINTVSAYSAIAPFPSFQRIAAALAVADPPQTVYFQGLFFLTDDLLNPATESWRNWRYYEPNPAEFADAQVTSTLMPPGAITIDVTL